MLSVVPRVIFFQMSVSLFFFYSTWTVCLLDLLDCATTSVILLIYFDVSITCYRVNVLDCACGNLKDSKRERGSEGEGEHNKTG